VVPPLGTIQLFEFFRKSQLVPSRAASLQTALQPLCNLSAFFDLLAQLRRLEGSEGAK